MPFVTACSGPPWLAVSKSCQKWVKLTDSIQKFTHKTHKFFGGVAAAARTDEHGDGGDGDGKWRLVSSRSLIPRPFVKKGPAGPNGEHKNEEMGRQREKKAHKYFVRVCTPKINEERM